MNHYIQFRNCENLEKTFRFESWAKSNFLLARRISQFGFFLKPQVMCHSGPTPLRTSETNAAREKHNSCQSYKPLNRNNAQKQSLPVTEAWFPIADDLQSSFNENDNHSNVFFCTQWHSHNKWCSPKRKTLAFRSSWMIWTKFLSASMKHIQIAWLVAFVRLSQNSLKPL